MIYTGNEKTYLTSIENNTKLLNKIKNNTITNNELDQVLNIAIEYKEVRVNIDACAKLVFDCFYLLHEYNNAYAIHKLGYFYEIGYHVKKDLNISKDYYLEAAELGFMDSIIYIGIHLTDGTKYEKDFKTGYNLLKKAADSGVAIAQYNLAIDFMNGEDIKKDLNEALRYAKLALAQKFKNSEELVKEIFELRANK